MSHPELLSLIVLAHPLQTHRDGIAPRMPCFRSDFTRGGFFIFDFRFQSAQRGRMATIVGRAAQGGATAYRVSSGRTSRARIDPACVDAWRRAVT